MRYTSRKGGFFVKEEIMAEKQQPIFDKATLARLKFVQWHELQSGRPDKHGVQTPVPVFESQPKEPEKGSRRDQPFFPDNMTGV